MGLYPTTPSNLEELEFAKRWRGRILWFKKESRFHKALSKKMVVDTIWNYDQGPNNEYHCYLKFDGGDIRCVKFPQSQITEFVEDIEREVLHNKNYIPEDI